MMDVYVLHSKLNERLEKARSKVHTKPLEAMEMAKDIVIEAKENRLATIVGRAYHVQTMACRTMGRQEDAFRYVGHAIDIFERFGDCDMLAELYRWQGVLYFYSGAYQKSLSIFNLGRSFALKSENHEEIVRAQNCIGEVYRKAGDFDKALGAYEEGISHGQAYKVIHGIGHILSNMGAVYTSLGKYAQANEKYQEAKAYFKTTSDVLLEFEWYYRMGKLQMKLGKYKEAQDLIDASIDHLHSVNNEYYLLDALLLKYEIYMCQDQEEKALEAVEEAEKISKLQGSDHQLSRIYEKMYQFYESKEMYKKALEFHKRYQFTLQKIEASNILIKLKMLDKHQATLDEDKRAHFVKDFIEGEMASEKLRIENLRDSIIESKESPKSMS